MKARSCTYRVVGAYFADMNAQLHFPSGKEKAFPGKHTYKNQHLNNSIKRNESLIISYTYLSEKKSLISYRSMEEAAPAAKRLARAGSFSGVWWKLGDAAGDPAAVERRLRAIGDEEAGVRAAIHSRQAAARLVRRRIAFASLSLEFVAFIHAYWAARRRRMAAGRHSKKKLLLLPLLAVPAVATVALAAFARFQKMFDARDEQKLKTLLAERKARIGQFRGSHHNMQMLIQMDAEV
ncbi:uncharacterized protein LOC100844187 isoform X2 [Brachypodium distachyon]|uniref:Uncharacterized protein n=1 Tax=Brachypodium distachyon TaxID=15368 RepID=A0A2K2D623_BRADI|nr:uncharacterized protein LOC100844187 isoform X2 [Brachypodium distachyon]PNT69735.1 hypothetical protein BRADI_3g60581v3 [Brachypodium distachyon]|eukprot:XP_014756228.2 uncharacterized protein LOC100844187 isoform X2 [Brachypodium distachyon]